MLEDKALPSIEIIPKQGFYDYENKYQPGAALEVCPAEIPPEWEAAAAGQAALRRVSDTSGCRCTPGRTLSSREDGTPYFLEINTLPGMTPTSLAAPGGRRGGHRLRRACARRIVHASLEARKQGR